MTLKILKTTSNTFDVFLFDGWEFWSRWYKDKANNFRQVGGKPVSLFIKAQILNTLGDKHVA